MCKFYIYSQVANATIAGTYTQHKKLYINTKNYLPFRVAKQYWCVNRQSMSHSLQTHLKFVRSIGCLDSSCCIVLLILDWEKKMRIARVCARSLGDNGYRRVNDVYMPQWLWLIRWATLGQSALNLRENFGARYCMPVAFMHSVSFWCVCSIFRYNSDKLTWFGMFKYRMVSIQDIPFKKILSAFLWSDPRAT